MAGQDKRINDLNPLSGADVANSDVMPIVDQSAFETKKINFQDLKSRITEGSAPLSSPTFTGEPKAPTVTPSNDSSTKIATTAFVQNALTNVTVGDATTTVKGVVKLAGDLGGTADLPTVPGLAAKAPINSPNFTGTPTAPTILNTEDASTKIATTAFVQSALGGATVPDATTTTKGKIKLSGDLGGTADLPTVPSLALKANISSPTFTGEPKAPTVASASDRTVKLATTEFVQNALDERGALPNFDDYPKSKPILNLDFANTKMLDPRIDFSRASKATRINEFGLIEEVEAGVPRFDHDPDTLESKGLLIEESRTNLFTHSNQFDNAVWSKNRVSIQQGAGIGPFGSLTAWRVIDTIENNTHSLHYPFTPIGDTT